jgi:GDPmannose 4,6-dehydratase
MTKTALISGATGQDGAYLAELLLEKGYIVHGIKRRSSLINTDRVDHLYTDPHLPGAPYFLHYGDMTDATNLIRIIQETQPDEIYNLAAQSHVQVSFETPEYTANADGLGTLRMLEAIRILGMEKKCRFYQASTSELYGNSPASPQNEETCFAPCSPYAAAKLYAYWITRNYREAYGMHASNGILFNHESPIRGETFVTRKVCRAIARIILGLEECLYLGSLDSKRDWGHARDYVQAMWMMLQQDTPDDYVIATGEQHSVREFAVQALAEVGIQLHFEGEGLAELGVISAVDSARLAEATYEANPAGMGANKGLAPGRVLLRVDRRYYRPTEVYSLLGDPSKARRAFGWAPATTFEGLVAEMVHADLAQALGRFLPAWQRQLRGPGVGSQLSTPAVPPAGALRVERRANYE